MNPDVLAFTGFLIILCGIFCIQQAHGSKLKAFFLTSLKDHHTQSDIESMIRKAIVEHLDSAKNSDTESSTPPAKLSFSETVPPIITLTNQKSE